MLLIIFQQLSLKHKKLAKNWISLWIIQSIVSRLIMLNQLHQFIILQSVIFCIMMRLMTRKNSLSLLLLKSLIIQSQKILLKEVLNYFKELMILMTTMSSLRMQFKGFYTENGLFFPRNFSWFNFLSIVFLLLF